MKCSMKSGLIAATQIGLLTAVMGGMLLSSAPANAQKPVGKESSFAAASTAWTSIEASEMELDKTVASGKVDGVHEIAFAIRDAVVTLPAKSAALPADKKKKLAGYTKTVSETATLLDKYGDSNNVKAVKTQQLRMKSTLKSIKALYPAGTFKAVSGSKMAPMGSMKM